jgi:hypothetical protein
MYNLNVCSSKETKILERICIITRCNKVASGLGVKYLTYHNIPSILAQFCKILTFIRIIIRGGTHLTSQDCPSIVTTFVRF